MGCGCGRNNKNMKVRKEIARKKALSARLSNASTVRKKQTAKKRMIVKRTRFCRLCPESVQTREERRNRTKVCHKVKVSVQSIITKTNFTCPLGNF